RPRRERCGGRGGWRRARIPRPAPRSSGQRSFLRRLQRLTNGILDAGTEANPPIELIVMSRDTGLDTPWVDGQDHLVVSGVNEFPFQYSEVVVVIQYVDGHGRVSYATRAASSRDRRANYLTR